jgi:hypothetical protein
MTGQAWWDKCPSSGKRVYYKEHLASRAVSFAATRGELPPMRHYKCPECGWWHLSKVESRSSDKERRARKKARYRKNMKARQESRRSRQ